MHKPRNYYCHKSQFPINILNQNYQIVQKIGQGAFGQVYKIFNPVSSQLHVIKKNKNQDQKSSILKENQIMKQMSQSQGFVKVKKILPYSKYQDSEINLNINQIKGAQSDVNNNTSKFENKSKCVMMECLGKSFGNIIEQQKNLSTFTTKRIAYQLIERLQQLHIKMYVHRDLKPDNILLGNQHHPHQIYLVDFGLVSKYRSNANNIRNIYQGVIGTAKFCSLASHLGNQQFPIDDLQSLGYVLVYLIKGELPWKSSQSLSQNNRFQQIKSMKQQISIEQLSGGVSCLKKYFKIIKSLRHQDKIPYQKLLQIFLTDAKQQFCFQFCKDKCIQKIKRKRLSNICQQKQELNQENNLKFEVQQQIQPHIFSINKYKIRK